MRESVHVEDLNMQLDEIVCKAYLSISNQRQQSFTIVTRSFTLLQEFQM